MSYILEALRRAERERDTGRAPSVESLNRAMPVSERSRVPPSVWALAITTALIAGTALVVSLWPRSPAPAAQPAATAAPLPIDRPATPISAAVIDPEPAAIDDDVVSLDDVVGDDATEEDDTPPAAAPTEPEPAPAPTPDVAETREVPEAAVNAETPPPSLPSPASGDAAQSTIVVPRGATVLREMPASYREQFPVRTLDVHVYDPDPARRWIMVDGQRYREGSTLASGPQVVQIIDGGVIFEYQGARVLLPVR